ncbi:importin-beta N-terminal domain-containing protein [Cryptosporidium muris RN66]|uniref:Importin-beta N-terminal domain-containing protein n=1 Tax=Cryptosporidium muris (strain RN66) TaxID=441375 RepID=B6ABU3_CRYMR|nr:importin-beta N-terminal domain-containing protein [Cryptosporidium muris RN66]EEA05296.1 importin-beta N-terminal domain-containing protein [Cryptosporidium muris RN66]|eukprot:XP_002139645.1 importin-beta N-terminal domain-containing protein [Cryptosporidium muris RN66]
MDLTPILLNCHNPVESIRKSAEQQLHHAQEANFGDYLVILADELHNESKPELSRQLAGLLLKNAVSAVELRLDIERRGMWISLPQQITNKIKSAVLESLLSPLASIRGAACQVIAKLGRVELPCQRWPELLPYLLRLIQESKGDELSLVHKRSALTALGYLCEDSRQLENEVASVIITDDISNQILTAIIQGMNDSDIETSLAATKSFYFALFFARNNFKNEHERNLIFQVLCNLCGTEGVKRELLQTAAYECLVSIAAEYYEYLGPYLPVIAPMVIKSIKGIYEPVAICCIEFWNTIADLEIDLVLDDEQNSLSIQVAPSCLHYIRQIQSMLIPVMLETLLKQNDDDSDPESWTVAKAAGACLTLCAQLLGDNILEPTLSFIHANFSHTNWHNREAAVLAYGSILEGPSFQRMQPIVESSVTNLCQALNDNAVAVRDTCAWTIGRIVTFHPSIIFPLVGLAPQQQQNNGNSLLAVLLQRLLTDEARVCANICWVIHQLAETSTNVEGAGAIMDMWFPYIIHSLLQASKRSIADEYNMKQACYNAISMVVTQSGLGNTDNLVNLTKELIIGEEFGLQKLVENNLIPKPEPVATNIQLTCGVLYALTTKLGKNINQYSSILLRLYFDMLRQGGANEEILIALTALIVSMGLDFSPYLQECITVTLPYMQRYDELETCKISIELVGDMVRSVGQNICPYLDTLVQTLCTLLAKSEVDRKIKPLAIISLGDLAMNLGHSFVPYIGTTLQLFQQAALTQYNDGPINSEDWIEYLGELREAVLQGYTSIVYGMKDAQKLELIGSYVPNMIQFVNNIVNDYNKEFPNDNNLKSATALIGDLITAFNGQLVQYLMAQDRRQILENICSVGEISKHPYIINNIKWIKKLCQLPS